MVEYRILPYNIVSFLRFCQFNRLGLETLSNKRRWLSQIFSNLQIVYVRLRNSCCFFELLSLILSLHVWSDSRLRNVATLPHDRAALLQRYDHQVVRLWDALCNAKFHEYLGGTSSNLAIQLNGGSEGPHNSALPKDSHYHYTPLVMAWLGSSFYHLLNSRQFVLGCIKTTFCKKARILLHFSRSTQLPR